MSTLSMHGGASTRVHSPAQRESEQRHMRKPPFIEAAASHGAAAVSSSEAPAGRGVGHPQTRATMCGAAASVRSRCSEQSGHRQTQITPSAPALATCSGRATRVLHYGVLCDLVDVP